MEAHQQSIAAGLAREALQRQEEMDQLKAKIDDLCASSVSEAAHRLGLEAGLAKEAANRQRLEGEVQQWRAELAKGDSRQKKREVQQLHVRAQLASMTADNQHLAGQVAELTTGQGQIRACTRRLEAQADEGAVFLQQVDECLASNCRRVDGIESRLEGASADIAQLGQIYRAWCAPRSSRRNSQKKACMECLPLLFPGRGTRHMMGCPQRPLYRLLDTVPRWPPSKVGALRDFWMDPQEFGTSASGL